MAGVCNASGFTNNNPNAPQGQQVAFIQGQGSITQAVAFAAAGSYQITVSAAQRGSNTQDFQVLVDGVAVTTFQPTGSSYRTYATTAFTVSAGTHTISLRGLNSAGGDNTAFFDAVSLTALATSTPGGASATRWTVYDGQTPLLDFNASGTVTARYLSVPGAIDELLARQTASGVAWYLDDREGSVKDLITNSGTVLDHVDYTAYGQVQAESAPSQGDRFKYAGMELDAAIGLDYDRARYFDPAAGRFVGRDPSGFASGTTNLYQCVGNNPLNSLDPTGLAAGVLRPGDPGAPTIGQILGNTTIRQQLSWFWKRAAANDGREEGGWVLYNTCSGKFTLTVDGMTQTGVGSKNKGKIYRNGPPSIITPYYTTGTPSSQPTDPSSGPPPGFPVTGPPEPTGSCWFVVAAWHTHPGKPKGLSSRDPGDPIGHPGDFGPIDFPGVPVIVQWGNGPRKIAYEVP